jgi:hypothetical protein
MMRSIDRLLPLACCLAACGDGPTVVVVRVEGRAALSAVDTLDVTVRNSGGTASQSFTLAPGQTLPLTFTVTPEGRAGDLVVEVIARSQGTTRGRGTATALIASGGQADVTVTVDPDDFLVNEQIVRTQWISFDEDLAGRQLGVAPDGSFLVAWENDCPLSRCDILARRFDATTAPAPNATTMTAGELIVNQTSDSTVSPSIAVGAGGYMMAWLSGPDTQTIPADVTVTRLDFDGGHPGFEITVSADLAIERAPTVFARSDGSFVVVWTRERTAPDLGFEARGQILDAQGNLVGASFPLSAATTGSMDLPHGAGLPNGAFVVAWTSTDAGVTSVRARVFGASGVPATGNDVQISGGTAYGPRVVATADGFVIGWQIFSGATPELSKQPLIMRRYQGNGNPVSTEIPVALESGRINSTPTLAVRADGAIGAAWHDCADTGDAPDSCGIRFRLFHPTGMPAGDSIIANTTTARDQLSPSIVAFGPDAFLLGWTDNSQATPDTDGSGVRARVIYPSLERHDGQIGAQCGGGGDAECGAGLTCQETPEGVRLCHEACTVSCTQGGVCLNGTFCNF